MDDPQLVVEQALYQLLELDAQRAAIAKPYEERLTAIRETIAAQLRLVEAELDDATYEVDAELSHWTAIVEEVGPQLGHTIKVGNDQNYIQSIYYQPTFTINKKKFEGFAINHPEAWGITEQVPAKIQLRRGKV